MKTIRVSVLIALLACSVHAGVIQNGAVETPPPPPDVMQVNETQSPQVTVSPITEIVSLLQSLLTLF